MMSQAPLRLLAVLAHPDDESLGAGGILAKYAQEGVETFLLTATRGERGWPQDPETNPGLQQLGDLREAELMAAAEVLGLREVGFLGVIDGELDQADAAEMTRQIASAIQRIRPQVVVTFDPFGAYGHPDHIAICQLTTAAVTTAVSRSIANQLPHQVDKLYYMVMAPGEMAIYQSIFGDLIMNIDGVERRAFAWPAWAITTQVDTTPYWRQVWQAIGCHRTQLPGLANMTQLPEATRRDLFSSPTFYRAMSLVNGGRDRETDLFSGIREQQVA